MAYLGEALGHGPFGNFFSTLENIGKHGLAPFVLALVPSENLPPYEILNTPLDSLEIKGILQFTFCCFTTLDKQSGFSL